jgi:hypothetical protein
MQEHRRMHDQGDSSLDDKLTIKESNEQYYLSGSPGEASYRETISQYPKRQDYCISPVIKRRIAKFTPSDVSK